jgi:hypothetical protein
MFLVSCTSPGVAGVTTSSPSSPPPATQATTLAVSNAVTTADTREPCVEGERYEVDCSCSSGIKKAVCHKLVTVPSGKSCGNRCESCVNVCADTTRPATPKPSNPPPGGCTAPGGCLAPGWYGYKNSGNINREPELQRNCSPNFKRVPSYWGHHGAAFEGLCSGIGLKCEKVCDWEGNIKPCWENPDDGSRIAYCVRP